MKLEPCPASPNCVSSQADPSDDKHYFAPLAIPEASSGLVMEAVAASIEAAGGAITERADTTVTSIFTSRLFRFKDDVVFAYDAGPGELHFRSASRVGHSDLGVNRKRVTALLEDVRTRLA